MNSRNTTAVKVVLLFVIVAAIHSLYYGTACLGECTGNWSEEDVCGWFCRLSNNGDAVLTGYGIIITVLGFLFISKQIDQGNTAIGLTRESNEEVKRSYKAYINSERGFVTFKTSNYDVAKGMVNICWQNIGNGPVVIMRIAGIAYMCKEGEATTVKSLNESKVHLPLASGGYVSSFKHEKWEASIGSGFKLSHADMELYKRKGYVMVVQSRILYTTIQNTYHFSRFTFIDRMVNDAEYEPIPGAPWSFEYNSTDTLGINQRIMQDIEKHVDKTYHIIEAVAEQ